MKTKVTLFVTALTAALFGVGCASAQITETSLKKGLIGHYLFDGNTLDSSGNDNHGIANGTQPTTDRHGNVNSAYNFDGKDDHVILSRAKPLGRRENLSIFAWVKLNDLKTEGGGWTIYSEGYGGGYVRNQLRIHPNGKLGFEQYWPAGGPTVTYEAIKPFEKGKWYFVGISHKADWKLKTGKYTVGGKWILYVNGEEIGHCDKPEKPFDNAWNTGEKTAIGAKINGISDKANKPGSPKEGSSLNGAIDDLRLYNRALSESEILVLYDLEKPKGK